MIRLTFVEVRLADDGVSPIMILKESDGPRLLPIWISANAASAVLLVDQDESSRGRPGVHQLLLDVLDTQAAVVERVTVMSGEEGVFDVHINVNGMAVACRAADGIAIALRSGAPIFATAEVLDYWSVAEAPAAHDPEVERFRDFLSHVTATDFDQTP